MPKPHVSPDRCAERFCPDEESSRCRTPEEKKHEHSVPLTALCLLLCGVYFLAVTLADAYGDRFSQDSRIEAAVQAVSAFGRSYRPLAVFLGISLPQEQPDDQSLPTAADYLRLRGGTETRGMTEEEALKRYLEKYNIAEQTGEETADRRQEEQNETEKGPDGTS